LRPPTSSGVRPAQRGIPSSRAVVEEHQDHGEPERGEDGLHWGTLPIARGRSGNVGGIRPPISGTKGVFALLAYDPCVRRVYQPAVLRERKSALYGWTARCDVLAAASATALAGAMCETYVLRMTKRHAILTQ